MSTMGRKAAAAIAALTLTLAVAACGVTRSAESPAGERGGLLSGPIEPITDSFSPDIARPTIVADRAGAATVVYGERGTLAWASRSTSGVWNAPENLDCAEFGNDWCAFTALGVDAVGTVTAVWLHESPDMHEVRVATRQPGQPWTQPVTLSRNGWEPRLAVATTGAAMVAWPNLAQTRVTAAYKPADGSWADAQRFALRDLSYVWSLGIADTGTAIMSAYAAGEKTPNPLYLRRFTPQAGWSSRTLIGTGDWPDVAVGATGRAVVAWTRSWWRENRSQVIARMVDASGRVRAAHPLSSRMGYPQAATASVAMDGTGTALVGWSFRHTIRVAAKRTGIEWQTTPVVYRKKLWPHIDDLVADGAGARALLWSADGSGASTIRAKFSSAQEPWTGNTIVGDKGWYDDEQNGPSYTEVDAALLADGSVLATWTDPDRVLVARHVTSPSP